MVISLITIETTTYLRLSTPLFGVHRASHNIYMLQPDIYIEYSLSYFVLLDALSFVFHLFILSSSASSPSSSSSISSHAHTIWSIATLNHLPTFLNSRTAGTA